MGKVVLRAPSGQILVGASRRFATYSRQTQTIARTASCTDGASILYCVVLNRGEPPASPLTRSVTNQIGDSLLVIQARRLTHGFFPGTAPSHWRNSR